jgi:hypothetical protein
MGVLMDIATVATALTSIKTAFEIAKIIRDSKGSLKEAEINNKIADLLNALADAKSQVADIKTEILNREEKIKELEDQLRDKSKMVFFERAYFIIDGEKKEGPYCQQCWDSLHKKIRLQPTGSVGGWYCFTCKLTLLHFKIPESIPAPEGK